MDIPSVDITGTEALEVLDFLSAVDDSAAVRRVATLTSKIEKSQIKAKKQKTDRDFLVIFSHLYSRFFLVLSTL